MTKIEDQCWRNKPPGWKVVGTWGNAVAWYNRKKKLRVLASVDEIDGERWLHVSLSHPRRLPTYDELCYLKRHWFGADATAVEIHAPKDEHVNHHEFCRHLWATLDRKLLPDMRRAVSDDGELSI